MDITNNETFQTAILVCFSIAVLVFLVLWQIFKKKGINVYSRKIQILLLFAVIAPISLVPIWLHPLISSETKIIATLLGATAGLANFYAIDRGGKAIRKFFGIKTEEDRVELEERSKKKRGNK